MDEALQRLVDREQIDSLLTAYAGAVDDQDWDRLDGVFAADATLDYRSAGGIRGEVPEVRQWLSDVLPLFTWTQHLVANRIISLDADGDGAEARSDFYNSNEMVIEGEIPLDDMLPEAPFADGGFPTPNGRVQCDVPGIGLPDYLPPYESVRSAPELARRFPLAMISPPARNFLNSTFVNVKSLRAIEQEPVLEIEAADAAARGIADGDEVRVFNDRGEYRCAARVNERARPGVVHGLGVWWRKYGLDGTNVNELTHQRLTDMGRAPSFYDCLVEVERSA